MNVKNELWTYEHGIYEPVNKQQMFNGRLRNTSSEELLDTLILFTMDYDIKNNSRIIPFHYLLEDFYNLSLFILSLVILK